MHMSDFAMSRLQDFVYENEELVDTFQTLIYSLSAYKRLHATEYSEQANDSRTTADTDLVSNSNLEDDHIDEVTGLVKIAGGETAKIAHRKGRLPYDNQERVNLDLISPHSTMAYTQALDTNTAKAELFRINRFVRKYLMFAAWDQLNSVYEGVKKRVEDIPHGMHMKRLQRRTTIQKARKAITSPAARI